MIAGYTNKHVGQPRGFYFDPTGLVAGLVSGIKNQRTNTETRATAAMLRNTTVRPKLTAMTPNSAVLSEAPTP
jgi:hypothetical protein